MNYKLIKKIIEIFESNNIKIIADYGTLLGCIRNKGFIKTDKDLDFSIMLENDYENKLFKVIEKLVENNFKILKHQKGKPLKLIKIEDLLKNGRIVISHEELKPIDIFFWVKKRYNWKRLVYLHEDYKHNKGKILKDKWIKKIVYKKFEEIELPCPKEYILVLEHRYGDWKKEINYYK
jgi:phosphorylcholine metabolism protein LicD